MKYTQTAALVFGVVAAVLGIYAAKRSPYTDIAAGAVVFAAAVGVAQAFQAAKEAEFVEQILSHLVRSTPASSWWRTQVRGLIQTHAVAGGYRLDHIVYDARDPDEPDANAIFVFASQVAPGDRAGGVLVLTPADYAELSLCTKKELADEIEALIAGVWHAPTDTDADAAERICATAVALYGLRLKGGFRVGMRPHTASAPLIVELGDVEISFGPEDVQQVTGVPAIERDLLIAEALEKVEPDLGRYLTV